MNEIIQSLHDRKSVRAYEERRISPEDRQMILLSAMEAPLVLIFCADYQKWVDTFPEAGAQPRKSGAGHRHFANENTILIFPEK